MKVLVTGASGFIGMPVTERLLASGHEVSATATNESSAERLSKAFPGVRIFRGSILDPAFLDSTIRQVRPQGCIHAAWDLTPGEYASSQRNLSFLQASLNLFQKLVAQECVSMVFLGTGAEYDVQSRPVVEEDALNPTTLYAACKASLGMLLRALEERSVGSLAWARLFFLYGPYEDERRLVAGCMQSLLRHERYPVANPDLIRDYLHVSDAASALVHLLEERVSGAINVCSGVAITVRDLMMKIESLTGVANQVVYVSKNVQHAEPEMICGNNDKLRALGWRSKFVLETGLRDTLAWWKSRAV